MEVPWTLNLEVSYDPAISFLDLGSEQSLHSKWHVHLDIQGSTIYNCQDRIHQCPLTEMWRPCGTLHTRMLLSHKAKWNNDIGSGMDEPRNYNSTWGKSERETNVWYVQVGYINPYLWTNVLNRLTAWENQIPIIKRKKRVWNENLHTNIYQVDNISSFLNRTRNCTEKNHNNIYEGGKVKGYMSMYI